MNPGTTRHGDAETTRVVEGLIDNELPKSDQLKSQSHTSSPDAHPEDQQQQQPAQGGNRIRSESGGSRSGIVIRSSSVSGATTSLPLLESSPSLLQSHHHEHQLDSPNQHHPDPLLPLLQDHVAATIATIDPAVNITTTNTTTTSSSSFYSPPATTTDSFNLDAAKTLSLHTDIHPQTTVAPRIIRHNIDPLLLERASSPLLSSAAVVRAASRSPTRSSSPHSTSYIRPTPPPSPRVTQASLAPPPSSVRSSLRKSLDDVVESLPDNMLFGQSTEKRRRAMANTNALTTYEADMTGRDRAKQKLAIQRFLVEKIKNDWDWPSLEEAEVTKDAQLELEPSSSPSIYAEGEWRARLEGESDMSDSDCEFPMGRPSLRPDSAISKATNKSGPFRFDSPDGVGETVKKQELDRKRRRRKRLADEMAINEGLNCFVKRRDAWTGARKVPKLHSKPKPVQAPTAADDGSSTAIDSEDPDSGNIESDWDYEMEVPVVPPLLPAENAMRASIGVAAYPTIYDKVIVQQLSPSCPINLSHITRACVQGWKRDGEWPPRATPAEGIGGSLSLLKKKRRKSSLAGILGLGGERDESGSPRSPSLGGRFKKILGIGKEKEKEDAGHENGNGNGNA
ncbi:hypothetical protein PVAG01_06066 [Phlyctema vagabunda]|uniref:Gag1-like clamp domain-containing protein n=1 Tax=Phlyctema vagabunda TaxID=108571 RepID=A0ABR4PFY9_9HELO